MIVEIANLKKKMNTPIRMNKLILAIIIMKMESIIMIMNQCIQVIGGIWEIIIHHQCSLSDMAIIHTI